MKKLFKKITPIILSTIAVTSLASCGENNNATTTTKPVESTTPVETKPSESTTTTKTYSDLEIQAKFAAYVEVASSQITKDNINSLINSTVSSLHKDVKFSDIDLSNTNVKLVKSYVDETKEDETEFNGYVWKEDNKVYVARDTDDFECGYGISYVDLSQIDTALAALSVKKDTDYVSEVINLITEHTDLTETEINSLLSNLKVSASDFTYDSTTKTFTYSLDTLEGTVAHALYAADLVEGMDEAETKTYIKSHVEEYVHSANLVIGYNGENFTSVGANAKVLVDTVYDENKNETNYYADINFNVELTKNSTVSKVTLSGEYTDEYSNKSYVSVVALVNGDTVSVTDKAEIYYVNDDNADYNIIHSVKVDGSATITNESATTSQSVKYTSVKKDTSNVETTLVSKEATLTANVSSDTLEVSVKLDGNEVINIDSDSVASKLQTITAYIDIDALGLDDDKEVEGYTLTITSKDVTIPEYNRSWATNLLDDLFGGK